jgi:adenylosuccinate lyase
MYPKYARPEMVRVWTDESLYDFIMQLEIANVEAWHEQGVVQSEALPALAEARIDWDVYAREFARSGHDLNSLVAAIASTLPPQTARWLHYQLTSYDPWDTARFKQLRDSLTLLIEDCQALLSVAQRRALEHKYSLMMGRTHGLHAEPTTFGQKIAVKLIVPLIDHIDHLEALRDELNLAKFSGAVGTHANVPEQVELFICKKLGLNPVPGATQVIGREWFARYANQLTEVSGSLRNFFTDIRLMAMTEVCEVEEPFEEGQVRSSAMPHKRNPEISERICGLSILPSGYAVVAQMLQALWYERSIDNSAPERVYLPDSSLAVDYILERAFYVLDNLVVFPNRMRYNLELTAGLTSSGRLSNKLSASGLTRSQAYPIAQNLTKVAWGEYQEGKEMPALLDLALQSDQVREHLSEAEIRECFDEDYKAVLQGVDVTFRRLSLIN